MAIFGRSLLVSIACGACLFGLGATAAWAEQINDISGAERFDDHSVVIVSDTKLDKNRPRLHMAVIQGQKVNYVAVPVAGWETKKMRSGDLEAICNVPNEPGRYYAAESGFYEGKGGRVFRLHVYQDEDGEYCANCEGSFQPFPPVSENYSTPSALQIEGMDAVSDPVNGEIILLGLRGNSSTPGVLVWGQLRDGKFIVKDTADIDLRPILDGRSIADLHLVPNRGKYDVLSVATTDPGDLGPYESAICLTGYFDPSTMKYTPCSPVQIRRIDGLKIEALGSTPECVPNSHTFYGTDDESFGGFLRPLRAHDDDPRNAFKVPTPIVTE